MSRAHRLLTMIAVAVSLLATTPSFAATVMLSANDGIETFSDGAYRMIPAATGGSLTALDISTLPPRVLWTLPLQQTAAGPPSGVAVTPNGAIAIVSNPATLDPKDPKTRLNGKLLQAFDLTVSPPKALAPVMLDHHPWGLAIDPSGHHALVANGDGTVTWLRIDGTQVSVIAVVTLGPPTLRTMSTAFTHDGHWALVTRRGDASVSALRIDGDVIAPVRNITVGSNPYELIVSPDGQSAAVSDIGNNTGDRNSVTLIDLRKTPFRAVDVFSVAPTPEGIAFSPDSRMLAVDSINGSNLKRINPFYNASSHIQLFNLTAKPVGLLGTADVGTNAQGLVFTPDGRSLIVQDFARNQLKIFKVGAGGLKDVGMDVPMSTAPSAVAVYDTP
jgi:DNA-binding beta-propeller fold protein YncE